ncbi:MAG: hypothetical protein OXC28_07550 [Defluviicoccus sp.]|nr:hypothetical protein [Defluviicoccus sp.]
MMRRGGASLAPHYEFEDRIPADAKARVEKIERDIPAGGHVEKINDAEPKSTS